MLYKRKNCVSTLSVHWYGQYAHLVRAVTAHTQFVAFLAVLLAAVVGQTTVAACL